jgi:hypothetical protein
MTFSVEWMQAVAASVSPGITYKGIAYEGDRPDISQDLPNGGIDLPKEPVYWILPDGRCVCWSVAELAEKKQDELLESNALKAYETIGNQLDFHPLGMLDDETFEAYRDNPGTLEERRHLSCIFTFQLSAVSSNGLCPPVSCSGLWERLRWSMPENETEACWWPYVLT